MSQVHTNKEKFMTDIKSVLADAEDLLKQAANTTGERASELSDKALTLLKQAKEKASDVQVVVVEKSKQAARATDDYVHDHPWQAVGIAAGIGVVIGLLLNRK
ncbi:YqjD family protein [Pandoraea sputorum]|nr:YqjD family protein [Pandoraea sputorum]MCE4060659.1 YqjD family protein [Pandoraea sputorum]